MILQTTPVQHHSFCGSVVKGFDLKRQCPGSSPRVIIHNLEQISQLRLETLIVSSDSVTQEIKLCV